MRKKSKAKDSARRDAGQQPRRGRHMGDTERWVYGFMLLFVSLFVMLAVGSYYFTWSDDQTIITEGISWGDAGMLSNHAGKMGAFIGAALVGRLLGAFALGIPVVLLILSLRVMRVRPLFLDKSVRLTFIIMILGSLSLGYLFGTRWGVFGTGLGGEAGIAAAVWLRSYVGAAGLGLGLVVAWVLVAVYINRNTIGFVNRMGDAVARKAAAGASGLRSRREAARAARASGDDCLSAEFGGDNERRDDGDFAVEDMSPTRGDESREYDASERGHDYPHERYAAGRGYDEPRGNDASARSGAEYSGYGSTNAGPEQSEYGASARNPEQTREYGAPTRPGAESREYASARDGAERYGAPWADGAEIEVVREQEKDGCEAPGGLSASAGEEDDFFIIAGDGQAEDGESPFVEEEQEPQDDDFTVVDGDGRLVKASTFREKKAPVVISAGGIVVGDDEGIEVVKVAHVEEQAESEDDALFRDPTRRLPRYQRPQWVILRDHSVGIKITDEEIKANQDVIREKLEDFGIRINSAIRATVGPTVTLYEIEPAQGVKVSRIRNLEEDIALALKVQSIRIMTLGAGRGTVGIEVPNSTREVVSMLSVVKSVKFQDSQYKLPIVLGKTIYNEIYIADLTKMPHLLVAGATGQGKSVGLNAIITSLLYKKHPSELKFVLVDPKQVELSVYSRLEKHFLAKMESEDNAIITDTGKAVNTLNSLVTVMEARYTLLNKAGERNISDYNAKIQAGKLKKRDGHEFMPYIVVVIDEFADMIMTAGREAEIPITRLAAKARAVGIHLIVATQRPDVKVITGLIKSNIPARVAFKVVSMVDSRTIIDQPGANNLIGMGDMLLYLNGELTRMQCAFLDTPEIENVVSFIAQQEGFDGAFDLPHFELKSSGGASMSDEEADPSNVLVQVAHFVVQNRQGSTSAIQRNFRLGYNRAGRIMDKLEKMGVVGRQDGSKPREVIVTDSRQLEDILLSYDDDELDV